MKLSVVIATYNRAPLLQRLLDQLCEQTFTDFEVVVVDDGSSPPARESIDTKYPLTLRWIEQPNAGAAAARDHGAKEAAGEVIVFIDDDMQIAPDFLARHLEHHAQGRCVVLGRLLPDPAIARMPFFERWHAQLMDRTAADLREGRERPQGALLYSGNFSVRREDYLNAGGFDRTLKQSEDVELGLRLEKAGLEFRFADDAATLHGSDHSDVTRWRARARRYGGCDLAVGRKHPDLRRAQPLRFLFELNPATRPFALLALIAPEAAKPVAGLATWAVRALDALRLFDKPAMVGTTFTYGIEYFRGLGETLGNRAEAIDALLEFLARHDTTAAGAWARCRADLLADHAMLRRAEAKYGHATPSEGKLGADVVQKIGLQILACYRVMRAFRASGQLTAAKAVSRMIRHLYGSDIHWDAELAPGVMIVHGMGLAISHAAKVGRGCVIFQNVTLGMGADPLTGTPGAPTLEEDVHVAPGATLIGPVRIGARTKIMPAAVVMRSVPAGSIVLVPEPEVVPRKQPSKVVEARNQAAPEGVVTQ